MCEPSPSVRPPPRRPRNITETHTTTPPAKRCLLIANARGWSTRNRVVACEPSRPRQQLDHAREHGVTRRTSRQALQTLRR
ncbi:hypothetical protein MTP99_008136 [Tenebrio molitor]|nr:hypothetical protein MTP99_008136 [Tenebrio molitor]